MPRLRPLCGVAVVLALLATVSAQNAVTQTCTGGARRQECGAMWAPNNAFRPTGICATCPADFGCTCPKADCMTIVSACLAAPGLVSYQVSLGGCKGAGSTGPKSEQSNIDWVAFQGVNSDNTSFTIHSAMNPNQNLYTFDNTTACDNIPNKDAASTCCLQRNVNGNGQINTFTVPCGTRPVVWMKDKSFSSCVQGGNIPDYLISTTGPNQCSGAGESTSNLCGPYALPQQSCEALQPCNPNEPVNQLQVTINNNNWADFSQTCIPGTICRFAANACEGDSYWNSACQCPALNPIRAGYCTYQWRGFDNNAVCYCGDDWWGINWGPVFYPRPIWWNDWWCGGRVCDTWRPNCRRPPCRPSCNYWGCPGWGGDKPPIKPCRGRGCPGFPGDKPITPCRGRDCVGPPTKPVPPIGECRGRHCGQICPKGSSSCPGFNTKPAPLPTRPEGGFGRPTKPRPERPPTKPVEKPSTLPGKTRPTDRPSTLPARPDGGVTTLPARPDGGVTTLPARPDGGVTTLPARPDGGVTTLPARPDGGVTTLPARPDGGVTTLPGTTGPQIPSTLPATTGPTTRPSTGGFGRPDGIVGGDRPTTTRPTQPALTLPGTTDTITTTRPTTRPTTMDRPSTRPTPMERPTPTPRPRPSGGSPCRPGQPGCPGSVSSRPTMAPSMRPTSRPTRPNRPSGGGGGGGDRGPRGGH